MFEGKECMYMGEKILGVIFDLDGVIVSTDNCHYLAWKRMADEEGIYFDRSINERLRGVSRMESLEIILERATRAYTPNEKAEMAARKNAYYVELIGSLTREDVLPGTMDTLRFLRDRGRKDRDRLLKQKHTDHFEADRLGERV